MNTRYTFVRPLSWRIDSPMLRLMLIIISLLSGSLVFAAPVGAETAFSGTSRIAVRVVDVDGTPLSGVALSLCPLESGQADARGTEDEECLSGASGADGRAVFEPVVPGEYRLTGNLTGFADTTVFPLSIGVAKPGPLAPDGVTLLLNPVCHDC